MGWRAFPILYAALSLLTSVGGCGVHEAELANEAKMSLVGTSESEMRMCAGFPLQSSKDKIGDIWMYEHGASIPGGYATPTIGLPAGTSINSTPAGYCRAQIRFVDGKVAEVSYAGETAMWGNRDAVCAQIIRACLDRLATRHASAQ